MGARPRADLPSDTGSALPHLHLLVRRTFVDAPVLVRAVAGGDRARTAVLVRHLHEMTALVRAERRAAADADPLRPDGPSRAPAPATELLRVRREAVAGRMHRLAVVLAAWERTADPVDRDAVARALDEVRVAVLAELAAWERAGTSTPAEARPRRTYDDHHVGWLLDCLPADERRTWLRTHLSLPRRVLWWGVGRHRFAEHRARVHGTSLTDA